ncbi:MAG: sigma-70 family RNA polymerase sigma factor [Halomonadaceae bacterium]|nr:MAG: sigma-70 family RNA polymerase sigma factor [Halomonadaceae bacterium]
MQDEIRQSELISLLGAVAQQDRQAFHRLYQQVAGRMFGLCRKLTGQQELAEEALQDAFIRIWHHAGEYHSERGAPLSWMMTIARNRTLDLMRSRKVHQGASNEVIDIMEDERAGPLDATLHQDGSAALAMCLDELSQNQRDSVLLSYYRGFTHEELAEFLGTPIGTIKSWIRRGLIAVRRCLER